MLYVTIMNIILQKYKKNRQNTLVCVKKIFRNKLYADVKA